MTPAALSVKRAVTVSMLILILVVLGGISLYRIGMDMFPDIEYPLLVVAAQYEGASPEDVEQLVTKPLEQVVATIKNVKKLTATSKEGVASVMVEFEWGTNLDAASQDIRDKLEMLKDFLPADLKTPAILKFDPSMIPVALYGITSGKRTSMGLRQVGDKTVKPALEQVDGIASCIVVGGDTREILVSLDRNKMHALGVGIGTVLMKLRGENINLPGGYFGRFRREYLVRTVGEFSSLEDIGSVILGHRGGIPIYLRDVGEVLDTSKEVRGLSRNNGLPSVMMIVYKESGANTVLVSRTMDAAVRKLQTVLPADIQMSTMFTQGEFILRLLNAAASNAVQGALLAMVLLWLFLRNLRPTLTIGLAIPVSIIAIFIPLYFLGFTLNFITLIGLALAVGMLVDNSIVVIENIYRHMVLGEDRSAAAIKGTDEVGLAITASTLTTIVVFVPLLFATGIAGRIFRDLALTVSFGLLASLLVALTIVPMIASRLFKPTEFRDPPFVIMLQAWYRRVIEWVLRNQGRTVLLTGLTVVIAVVLAVVALPKQFMPEMDQRMVRGMVKLPVGMSLAETDAVVRAVERVVQEQPEVAGIGAVIGVTQGGGADAAMGTGPEGVNEAELYIRMKNRAQRKRTTRQVIDTIRSSIPDLKGVKVIFSDAGMMSMGANPKPISIKLYGDDLNTLARLADTVVARIAAVRDVTDPESNFNRGRPEFQVRVNRERCARAGVSVGEVAQAIRASIQGTLATRMTYKEESVDIKVRMRASDRADLEDIGSIPVVSMSGAAYKLRDLADIRFGAGPVKLFREDQKRVITVTAGYKGKNLQAAAGAIKREMSGINMPAGYFYKIGGDFEDMVNSFRDLGLIFLLAVLLVYMVMAAQFESFTHPLSIMVTIPLAVVGVVIALFAGGQSLSLVSGMGVVVLAGIIVNNAIVYVDYVNQLRTGGMDKLTALAEAGVVRLRPILMTALTTILGMVPMVFDRSEGANMQAGVALTIIGGMTVGTLLTLIVLPTVYNLLERFFDAVYARARRMVHG